jgi:Uma2 family endonuclease
MTEQASTVTLADEEQELSPQQRGFYGCRPTYSRQAGGKLEVEYVPLTAEDLLDPRVDDEICQTGLHANLYSDVYSLLGPLYEDDPDILFTLRMKMIWGIEGLPNPIPDFTVIHGFRNPDEQRIVFDVPSEGVRPSLIIEVVTSDFEELRRNDYEKKVAIYERAGIPEYLILEPTSFEAYLLTEKDDVLLTGYRLDSEGRYQPIEPDSDGRLLSETTGLLFGKDEEGGLVVIDTKAAERLWNPRGSIRRAKREAEARRAAEAEIARLRAELDRRTALR